VLYGRLLDKNSYRCEPLTDLSYPVVLLQGGEGRGDRFIESLRGHLYGVFNVSKISDRNRARSKNHVQERSIFVFCSPVRAVAILQVGSRGVIFPKPVSRQLPRIADHSPRIVSRDDLFQSIAVQIDYMSSHAKGGGSRAPGVP
jgi:hypothetical protein